MNDMKKAEVYLDRHFPIAEVEKTIFSSFAEPLGRCIYGGLYDPGHPSADEDGFRTDVMKYIHPLNLTMNRFPGGNFTSTYRWEDGIGPKDKRPVRPELAWQSVEPNQFGLDEFARWSRKNHTDVMMTINIATRGVLEAVDCLEYCNFPRGTYWSEKRRENGFDKPLGYKYWCLSNEQDGVWQVGQKTGRDYGVLAREVSKAMKLLDPEIRTVLAGSSFPSSRTFPSFDASALEEAYDFVDYLSIHHYIGNAGGDSPDYLAMPLVTNRYFEDAAATIRYVKRKLGSDHDVYISFDEFNTWHSIAEEARFKKRWTFAPPLLEDVYTAEDAVALGGMFLAILRHADVVKIACVSELVNCISHIRTIPGGGCYVSPTYYSWLDFNTYGRGISMETRVSSDTYNSTHYKNVPYLDAQAVQRDDGGLVLFMINRSLEESMEVTAELTGYEDLKVKDHIVLTDDDPKAANSPDEPERVKPGSSDKSHVEGGRLKTTLAPMSWNVIILG